MTEFIDFDPVDSISAGAFGRPGSRTFLIQARKDGAVLSVLVEKEQVRLLARELTQFLDRLPDAPTDALDPVSEARAAMVDEAVPLFRARMIGLGYLSDRRLVLLELREFDEAEPDDDEEDDSDDEEAGRIARLYATVAQLRAMAKWGLVAVEQGRPPCPLCQNPMDPDGHICPRWN
jgi:uncharacterized repeat protein (TIGR03847 family)